MTTCHYHLYCWDTFDTNKRRCFSVPRSRRLTKSMLHWVVVRRLEVMKQRVAAEAEMWRDSQCKRPVRIMTKGSFNYGVNHRSSSNRQRHAELRRGRDGFIFTPSPCPITGTGGRGDTLPCPDMMDGYFSSEEKKKTQKNTVAAGSETERPTEKRPNCAQNHDASGHRSLRGKFSFFANKMNVS